MPVIIFYKRIKKKHGEDMISLARSYEQLKTKYMKTAADIVFTKICKIENLIPTFVKIKLSVKDDNKKLTRRIARILMESQLQSKHREKKELKKGLSILNNQLKTSLYIILYNTLIHQVNIAITSHFKAIRLRHNKKLIKFRKGQQKYNKSTTQTELVRNIVHNFSSYALSHEELNALSYGLDHHIPTKANKNAASTEFEHFFQNLLKDISSIPESELAQIKTKLRNSCEKYCNVKVPKHQKNVINNLMKSNDIVIIKQDKGRGVVIMDKSKYTEKGLTIISTKQFQKLKLNPTKSTEEKVQRMVRKIISKLTIQEYNRLYPSGSCPGTFYDTVKLHKVDPKGLVKYIINFITLRKENYEKRCGLTRLDLP